MRKRYAWPAYLPDQLPRDSVLVTASNVLPTEEGYRPVKSFSPIGDPVSDVFNGGGSFISTSGSAYLIAGTKSTLERYTAGSWTVSASSLTVPDRWRFTQFGDYVVAVNGGQTQQIDLNSGAVSDLTDAPTGNAVAVVGDFVVITQADGNILMVQWSAFNDHTAWTPAVDQSGFQPMLTGGEVKGIAGGEYGVILQRFRLVRMELSGDNTAPFTFSEITPNFGCASSGSIAQAGRTIFFLSDRGFMALDDGTQLRPIGNEKFDKSFRDYVSQTDYEKMWATVDPKRSLVMWGIPGTPGRIWVYNWVLDRATTIDMPFLGFFSGYESSQTLEEISAIYTNLDTMPYSLDDPRFQGGDPRVYFVANDSTVGALAGGNLEATLTIGWGSPADPYVARGRAVWPIGDATGGITVSVDTRQRMGDVQEITSSGNMQVSGRAPIRFRGRYIQTTITHAAGSNWSYDQGFDLEFDQGGTR